MVWMGLKLAWFCLVFHTQITWTLRQMQQLQEWSIKIICLPCTNTPIQTLATSRSYNASVSDVAVRKCHLRLNKVLDFFTCTSSKSAKLFTTQHCQAYAVKPMLHETCIFITNVCLHVAHAESTRLHQVSQAYCMTGFSCKQLGWFPGWSAGKKNQDFVQPMVELPYNNIWC